MTVSAKCYYALRAIYALAEHQGTTPLKAGEIAERQHVPIKFLEAILSQLKGGGFDGPIAPVDCVSVSRPKECEYPGHCPFFGFWGRVRQAISDVVDQTTFADLIKENAELGLLYVPEWTI
jgi:Rrf2 family cysteine metabolism transcriptional repressor